MLKRLNGKDKMHREDIITKREKRIGKFMLMMRFVLYLQYVALTAILIYILVRYVVFHSSPDLFSLLALFSMLILILAVNIFFLIKERITYNNLTDQLEQQQDAYENIKSLNETLRAQRHDFLNHIQVLYTLMELGEYKETSEYLDNLYQDVGKISARIKTKSVAVNALLQAKGNEAERLGIQFVVDIKTRFEQFVMPDWEVCRVIGNLIDNAFEACKHVHEPKVVVSISEKVKVYELKVVNDSMPIKKEDLMRFFDSGYTTKEDGINHGMGLSIVKRLVERYDGDVQLDFRNGQVEMVVSILKSEQ